jgi:hypothetical protein
LLHRGAVIIVVEVILPTAAPGNVARQGDDAVIRSLRVVKPRRHRIRRDVRDAEGGLVPVHTHSMTAISWGGRRVAVPGGEVGPADVADVTVQPGGAGRADAVPGLQPAAGARDHGDAKSVDRISLARLPLVRAAIWCSSSDASSTIYGGLTRRYVLASVLIIRWVRDVRMFVGYEDTEHSKCRTLDLAYARFGTVRPL